MPKAVGVTFWAFSDLKRWLQKYHFRRMSRQEVVEDIIVHDLVSYKKSTKSEEGFVYKQWPFKVIVWTTCLRYKVEDCEMKWLQHELLRPAIESEIVSRPPGTDMGWVVIIDERTNHKCFSAPFHRTKYFIVSLFQHALIAQFRVDQCPLCKKCGKNMEIYVQDNGGKFWACLQKSDHDTLSPTWLDWDYNLPEKTKAINAVRREKRAYTRKKTKKKALEAGREPRQARFIRKPRFVPKKT